MNSIYYIDEEPLEHRDFKKNINSFLWKILYKRVKKNLDSSIINIENFRKIVFNKKSDNHIVLEDSILPLVILKNNASLYLCPEDSKEYYIPLSIAFCSPNLRLDIVLIEGELELRNVEISKKEVLEHKPMLLVKNLKILEKSFRELLNYLDKLESK
jgi:uncharacterized pyridoxamine 5'-phosphate oxidase family protein